MVRVARRQRHVDDYLCVMHTCYHPALRAGLQALPEDEALHVVRVLRAKEGDALRLVNGEGAWADGEVAHVSKRSCDVRVLEVHDEGMTRPEGLVLVVAPTKHTDRFEWLLEKATELGVEAIVPVWTARSERRIEKHERWDKVLVAATKQSQRRWKPVLHPAVECHRLLESHPWLATRAGAVAHCMDRCEGTPERRAWTAWQSDHASAWLAVGPEGDFTEAEVRQFTEWGAAPVHLGALRLRTETAGIAAVAQFGQG